MSTAYNHKTVEKKWQKYWQENETFKTDVWDFSKPKYYALDMFPYPSGVGLHAGHPEGYTATDIMSRMKRMQGYNVLHPMGYDSFGLPAEQYAVTTGNHPAEFTQKNIATFSKQLRELGFDYDWSKMIATSDPKFYKWTQWIFKKLYEAGYAKHIDMPVNWCEELGTVLSNDEVIDGKSERGGYPVVRKNMKQWVIDQPAFAEKLLEGLEEIDWPESTKDMQRNWIGKSTGVEVEFEIVDGGKFSIFTTCIETIYGITFMVLAPDGEIVKSLMDRVENKEEVEAYIAETAKKNDFDRTELNKTKSGCRLEGIYCINPVNGKKIPIWISDYVLASYGTGAIMAVPAHDDRDYEFAKKFGIEIIPVLEGGNIEEEAYTEDGVHINSEWLNGLGKQEAIDKMVDWLQEHHCGQKKVSYKLRDWLFSRQRYWGEPIPIVHMEDGTMRTVPVEELPLELPATKNFQPHDSGESPLANCEDWLEVEIDGQKGRRETNTMPQWAGSCWYYIRYIDPHNSEQICDPKLLDKWLPVDLYVGGAEHAVLHLLYSRFWHKVLYDCGVVKCKEPWQRLVHQGMILGDNNEKMSKSRGNVVNPDDIVASHGADSLRLYEMFMGPLEASLPWSTNGLDGSRKWLDRVYRLMIETGKLSDENDHSLDRVYHQTVKKVTDDFEKLGFNTAISQMMIFINECYKAEHVYKEYAENFIKMLSCIAPHICEEMWQQLGHNDSIAYEPWPTYDEKMLVSDTVQMGIQVNGKLRAKIEVAKDADDEAVKELAFQQENVKAHTDGKNIVKVIVVKNKIVNIVVK